MEGKIIQIQAFRDSGNQEKVYALTDIGKIYRTDIGKIYKMGDDVHIDKHFWREIKTNGLHKIKL